jgi:hypothetical protein
LVYETINENDRGREEGMAMRACCNKFLEWMIELIYFGIEDAEFDKLIEI